MMYRNVFLKGLRDQRRAWIGWSIGIALLVLLEAAIWPSIRDMSAWKDLLAAYPEPMRKLFNLEEFTTGTGFMNAELFSAMLPLLFIIYGVGRGARAVAGEEEAGTLDVLLVTPVSPARLLWQQAASVATGLAGLGVVLYVTVLAGSSVFDMGIGAGDLAGAMLAIVLLGVEFAWLALALGAATGRRALSIAVSAAIAVASYMLYAIGQIVESVQPWQPVSPFHQALSSGPLGGGLEPGYLWMPAVAVLTLAAAQTVFDRRDIAAR